MNFDPCDLPLSCETSGDVLSFYFKVPTAVWTKDLWSKSGPFKYIDVAQGHRGQTSKQIDIAKYVSKFLIYGAKMLDKCLFFTANTKHCKSLGTKKDNVQFFFSLLTHISNTFAPYIKNLETYFAILICFEFWPMWQRKNYPLKKVIS